MTTREGKELIGTQARRSFLQILEVLLFTSLYFSYPYPPISFYFSTISQKRALKVDGRRHTVGNLYAMTLSHAYRIGGITFNTPIIYHSFTEYWSPTVNQSTLDEAWDALDTNPIAIALHDDYAEKAGLTPSTRFPWDTERSVYYLRGFHDLHCLVCNLSHITLVTNFSCRNSYEKLLW